MGSRYLTDLADVVAGAGIVCQVEPGWESRARSSGGYSGGLPVAVMVHHTASGPSSDGQADVDYMCYRADARPIANLYLSRSGRVWVMAAGATNTNGSGGPLGPVPADSMNSHAVGIEAGNNGVGEVWPDVQQDVYTRLCRALCDAYAIAPGHVFTHAEWAPGRKIDPAGPSRWATSGTWPGDRFRADVAAGGGPAPVPTPEVSDSMLILFNIWDAKNTTATFVSNGMTYRWLPTQEAIDAIRVYMDLCGLPSDLQTCNSVQLGWAGQYVDGGVPATNPYL